MIDRLNWGGAERVVVSLACGLHARGLDVRLMQMGSRGPHPWGAELLRAGVPVLDLGLRSLLDPRPVLRLAAYLRRERIDLLHTHLRYSDLVGRAAAALAHRPVISTIHGIAEVQLGWREAIRRRLDYFSARAVCPLVLTVSDAQRQVYQRAARVDCARLETHRTGVDTARFRPDAATRARLRAQLGVEHQTLLYATVAVLRPGKGVQHLLEATALVQQQMSDVRVLVIGPGEKGPELRAQAVRLGLADTVCFLGPRNDVEALLTAADVYVHPSLFEALSTSVLEAMSTGLPVVATDVGGVPEVVAHGMTGLLVPPAQPAHLAEAMLRLRDPALRTAFGAAGRAWVEGNASAAEWIEGMEKVYRRITRRSASVALRLDGSTA
jgi:glycosyltransferase involved in cell wall biosynthesis